MEHNYYNNNNLNTFTKLIIVTLVIIAIIPLVHLHNFNIPYIFNRKASPSLGGTTKNITP